MQGIKCRKAAIGAVAFLLAASMISLYIFAEDAAAPPDSPEGEILTDEYGNPLEEIVDPGEIADPELIANPEEIIDPEGALPEPGDADDAGPAEGQDGVSGEDEEFLYTDEDGILPDVADVILDEEATPLESALPAEQEIIATEEQETPEGEAEPAGQEEQNGFFDKRPESMEDIYALIGEDYSINLYTYYRPVWESAIDLELVPGGVVLTSLLDQETGLEYWTLAPNG